MQICASRKTGSEHARGMGTMNGQVKRVDVRKCLDEVYVFIQNGEICFNVEVES